MLYSDHLPLRQTALSDTLLPTRMLDRMLRSILQGPVSNLRESGLFVQRGKIEASLDDGILHIELPPGVDTGLVRNIRITNDK